MTIQEVASKAGLSVDVVRVWERRYAAVLPERTATNRRRYSSEDLRRLILLREAVAGGHAISHVATLKDADIRQLLGEAAPSSDAAVVTQLLMHVHAYDAESLYQGLIAAAHDREAADFCDGIAAPLLREVGEYWLADISLTAKEHVTSSAVTAALTRLTEPGQEAPRGVAVFATLPHDRHVIGAQMAAYVASRYGYRTLVLGSGASPDEVANVAKSMRAAAVGISLVYQDGNHTSRDLAARLDGIPLLVGGAKAQHDASWTQCDSMNALAAHLSKD